MLAYELHDILRTLDELPHRRTLLLDDQTDEEKAELEEVLFADMTRDERYAVSRVIERLGELYEKIR